MAIMFTEQLDIADREIGDTWDAYLQCIERVRLNLGQLGQISRYGIPVIGNFVPRSYFDVVLLTSDTSSTTFRISCTNLYLIGYKRYNDTWSEFDSPTTGLYRSMDTSERITFGESYVQLMSIGDVSLDQIIVGQESLYHAARLISISRNVRELARSLIIVIVMICEGIRFKRVSEFFYRNFRENNLTLGDLVDLFRTWEHFSKQLLRLADHGEEGPERTLEPNRLGVSTVTDVINVMGVLLNNETDLVPTELQRRGGRRRIGRRHLDGSPLMEIISVRVRTIRSMGWRMVAGFIDVDDCLCNQFIYYRGEFESVTRTQNQITLTGPSRCILAYNSITIKFHLYDADGEIDPWQVVWDSLFNPIYNTFVRKLNDNIGLAVSYIVYSNAVQTTVEVRLGNCNNGVQGNVSGRIRAHERIMGNNIVLFNMTDRCTIVNRGKQIPLLRSKVAVPLASSLIIKAELWDMTVEGDTFEIANERAEFEPQLSGTDMRYMLGIHGSVQVTVTWVDL